MQKGEQNEIYFAKGRSGFTLAKQIYHLESQNLVQNCPIASSYRNINHCLTIISYIISRILNVREGYPHLKYTKFLPLHAQKMANGGQYILFNFCITQIELKLNATHKTNPSVTCRCNWFYKCSLMY